LREARLLSQSLPGLLEKVTSGKIVWQFGNRYGWSNDTQLKLEHFIAARQSEILAWSGQAGTAVAKALQNVAWVVLVPILAIFFLRDGRQFSATLLPTFGELNQRRLLRLIMTDLDVMLARFIRAQLILAGISLVAYTSCCRLCGFRTR
jgi:predicted PurR-regulated permease PerM